RTSTKLQLSEEGIWISNTHREVSFPKEGHDFCLQVEEQSFWFGHRNRCLIEVLKNYPPGGMVFDIGAGNGFWVLGLKRRGFDTAVVEPGIEGARNARSRGLDPVICSTLEGAGFALRSIPAIGLFDVLEHIEYDTQFLIRIKSLLVKGGRLYLTVPAYQSL